MDKNILSEELSGMKYLFGYQPGKVISEQEQPEMDEYFHGDIEDLGERHPERLVKHKKTNKIVGTYKHGDGFHPSEHGEELGYEYHPTEIPHGTKFGGIEIDDFDYDKDLYS